MSLPQLQPAQQQQPHVPDGVRVSAEQEQQQSNVFTSVAGPREAENPEEAAALARILALREMYQRSFDWRQRCEVRYNMERRRKEAAEVQVMFWYSTQEGGWG